MHEKISNTKEFFLDMLHLFGVFLSSGYSTPPEFVCDRERYYEFLREYEEVEAKKLVYELKRQKLIRLQKKGNEVMFKLTQKGEIEAIKETIRRQKRQLPDDQVCFVSFDIPENINKVRFAFRRLLKQSGFKQVHLSVMETRLDVLEPLKKLVEILKIEKWVKIYKGKQI